MFSCLCFFGNALALHERSPLAPFQRLLGVQQTVQLDGLRHEPGPARLMARTQSSAVVSMEVFIEEDVIAPMRIALELLRAAVDRALALLIPEKYIGQPIGDLFAHLEEVHHLPRPRGALDLEVVAVVQVEIQQRAASAGGRAPRRGWSRLTA